MRRTLNRVIVQDSINSTKGVKALKVWERELSKYSDNVLAHMPNFLL